MSPSQREPDRIMIECRGRPTGCRVASLTSLRQRESNVVRIARFLKVRQMATHASCGGPLVLASKVTGGAGQRSVHSGQRKIRWRRSMIKFGTRPGVDRVAQLALRPETGCDVVRCRGLLEGVLMAGVALRRQALKLSYGRALVAVCAVQAGVPTDQRETVFVLPHTLEDDVPPLDRVALLTIGSHLAAMDVGVAIRAVGSGVGKHGLGVALSASHALVQAPKRILCLVVIEFRDGSNRLPANRRVAVLARNV